MDRETYVALVSLAMYALLVLSLITLGSVAFQCGKFVYTEWRRMSDSDDVEET